MDGAVCLHPKPMVEDGESSTGKDLSLIWLSSPPDFLFPSPGVERLEGLGTRHAVRGVLFFKFFLILKKYLTNIYFGLYYKYLLI